MIRVALALLLLSSPALGELRIVSPRDGARVSHDGPINIIARNEGATADSIIIIRDGTFRIATFSRNHKG
jgi:hypothetical protein